MVIVKSEIPKYPNLTDVRAPLEFSRSNIHCRPDSLSSTEAQRVFSGGEDPLSNVSAGTSLPATAESAGTLDCKTVVFFSNASDGTSIFEQKVWSECKNCEGE